MEQHKPPYYLEQGLVLHDWYYFYLLKEIPEPQGYTKQPVKSED